MGTTESATQESEPTRVDWLIEELVTSWPEPTPEQAERLRRLLASARPSGEGDGPT
jgi:hypothetical protein